MDQVVGQRDGVVQDYRGAVEDTETEQVVLAGDRLKFAGRVGADHDTGITVVLRRHVFEPEGSTVFGQNTFTGAILNRQSLQSNAVGTVNRDHRVELAREGPDAFPLNNGGALTVERNSVGGDNDPLLADTGELNRAALRGDLQHLAE